MVGIAIFDDKKETIHLTWYNNNIDISKLNYVAFMVSMIKDVLDLVEREIREGDIPDIPKGLEPREAGEGMYDWFKGSIN